MQILKLKISLAHDGATACIANRRIIISLNLAALGIFHELGLARCLCGHSCYQCQQNLDRPLAANRITGLCQILLETLEVVLLYEGHTVLVEGCD